MTEQRTAADLARTYTPSDVEDQITQRWNDADAFHADPAAPADVNYAIVIPPPNVTAALHMGHALNNTLQDILIRWHRMQGHNTLWMPGTDHAGIATQTVVDKRLQLEGQPALQEYKKTEAEGGDGRGPFIAKVQAWKDEYEQRITDQLKAMGCSCDWDRQRFTMDDVCAAAVREAFFQLFKDGLIYRGKRLVNWDPVTQTALADDEVEMEDIDGQFYYMRYPLLGPPLSNGANFVTVATTRPETMLGDTAVAVNPKDPRAAELQGRKVLLPIVNREIPIIEDDYVVLPDADSDDAKAQYASGFLKVTPAHDPNDWEIGQRHGLDVINVMAPDASISKDHGWPESEWDTGEHPTNDAEFLLGKDRYEARKLVVAYFKDHGLLEEVKPYRHTVGHSYRSHVAVEPYLSDQWYVKVTDDRLAGAALSAMAEDQRSPSPGCVWKEGDAFGAPTADGDGQLRFYPDRYAKTFQTWHENIRDWCISRQLWWGHRIPVWKLRDDAQIPLGKRLGDQVETLAGLIEEGRIVVSIHGSPMTVNEQGWQITFGVDSDEPDESICICVRDPEGEDRFLVELLEVAGFVQDPDVLDTWFSSGLWPISTMGWPNPAAFPDDIPEGEALLKAFNPSTTLCTAREIITLWVSRMVMFNRYFRGCLPFTDVVIHAMIQDGEGQKMSKSLGNGVDPLDIIHSHGSDAMRYTLTKMATQTQDVRMPVDVVCPHTGEAFTPKMVTNKSGFRVAAPVQDSPSADAKGKKLVTSYGLASGEATPTDDTPLARNSSPKFDEGRNFSNKVWNAVRFALMSLEEADDASTAEDLSLADRWILSRLAATVRDIDAALSAYNFSPYASALYEFFWGDLCDWYIEAIKPTVRSNATQQQVLATCIDVSLRLMHPAMPFITEKLWESLNAIAPQRSVDGLSTPPSDLLVNAAWPKADASLIDRSAEATFNKLGEVIVAIRDTRKGVPPRQNVPVTAKAPAATAKTLSDNAALINVLCNVTLGDVGENVPRPGDAAAKIIGDAELYLHGLLDSDAEKSRLTKQLDELRKSVKTLEGRLSNKNYTEKAPAHLVQDTRDKLEAAQKEVASVEAQLAAL